MMKQRLITVTASGCRYSCARNIRAGARTWFSGNCRRESFPKPFQNAYAFRELSTNQKASRQEERERERMARKAKREAAAKKRAEMEAYIGSINQENIEKSRKEQEEISKTEQEEKEKRKEANMVHDERRVVLLAEAGAMTRCLYRVCMRSVQTIQPGNEYDEKQFKEQEEKQMASMAERATLPGADFFSIAPPVDRKNELSSRAAYYYSYARENFEQESDCLRHDPWSDKDIERYLLFLKKGEKTRRFLLKDYKFEDPRPDSFDKDRVQRFEKEAMELVRDIRALSNPTTA